MVNRFKDKFGDPENVVIFMGDWSPQKGMRYKEPVKGRGMRKIFKKRGYQVYLVDEYNSSKKMLVSGVPMEKFKRVQNKEYLKELKEQGESDKPKTILVHGLLRSQPTEHSPCQKIVTMNRNVLGSLNIREKGLCHLNNRPIPEHLDRKKRKEYNDNESDDSFDYSSDEDMDYIGKKKMTIIKTKIISKNILDEVKIISTRKNNSFRIK